MVALKCFTKIQFLSFPLSSLLDDPNGGANKTEVTQVEAGDSCSLFLEITPPEFAQGKMSQYILSRHIICQIKSCMAKRLSNIETKLKRRVLKVKNFETMT
jgi:hypothetical protein